MAPGKVGYLKGYEEPQYRPSTLGIHGDDHLNNVTDVAPPMHVSTTFRYSKNPDDLFPADDEEASPTSN